MADDAAADATIARFLDAGGRLDLPAFLEILAPNVRLRSPISFRARFEGFDEVAELLRIVFDLIDEIEYYESLGSSTARALFFKARLGDDTFDGAIHVLLDEHALV